MSAMEKALLEATGAKPQKKGEDRQKFLIRLVLAAQKLPDDDWEGLDGEVQGWCNAAIEADNAEKPVPDFPDAEEPEEEEEEVETEEEEEEPMAQPKKPKKTDGKAAKKVDKSKKPKKTGAAKVAKPAKPAAEKKTSMRRALKRMVVKKPSRTVDDLIEALDKAGYKSPSRLTVSTIRADTRDTIKVLNEAGLAEIEITDGRAKA